jgi:hypothetical protein
MKQIADWFKKLGISEHTERCAENRIDLSVHLEELDVALGHRLRILRAIREPSATVAVAQPAASATRFVHVLRCGVANARHERCRELV